MFPCFGTCRDSATLLSLLTSLRSMLICGMMGMIEGESKEW